MGRMVPVFKRAALASLAAAGLLSCSAQNDEGRHLAAPLPGSAVMSFDSGRVRHIFYKNSTGGVQIVVAQDPKDTEQVELIRGHLSKMSAEFAAGDFTDPASVHGRDMPGLASLSAGFPGIDFRYSELPGGAQISYRTAEASMVEALHEWFDAQAQAHGPDPVARDSGHTMSEEMWRRHHPGLPYSEEPVK